jgi:hypothetical protein
MTKETTSKSSNKQYDRFFDGMIEVALAFYKMTVAGLKTEFYKKKENLILTASFILLSWVMIYKKQHLKVVEFLPNVFQLPLARFIDHFGNWWTMSFATVIISMLAVMVAGFATYRLIRKYQRALDHLDLKSGLGHRPVVVNVDSRDEFRTRILVKSTGLGEDRYKSKLDDLRASVGQQIESVTYLKKDNRFVEISLAHRLLENKVNYADLIGNAKKPFSFVVGKSQNNVVTENLEDVPHYLIAGSTGGGKSVAFKSMLLGLLETSERIQLYIFDFKQVEMNEFSVLPNVQVIKDEHQASLLLEGFVKEMNKRYKMLEAKKEKKVNPERDKLPRIVIGIDECSDLLGKVKNNDPKFESMERAKRCLNELSRKARASGIHLIFATQKVDMNSIETQIQENLEGRLSFRMNTIENSVRVLQNSMSYYLPSIAGRAIWKKGANYTEVQCPFLSDDELNQRIDALKEKFDGEEVTMVEPEKEKVKDEESDQYLEGQTFN